MLFDQTEITGLFCFENRKRIFDNVDSRFKFVVLTFRVGGETNNFPAAFMRHDVADLQLFPSIDSLLVPVDLIKKLSPDSVSVIEFKGQTDIEISKKMLRWPLLYGDEKGWNFELYGEELNMTRSSDFFLNHPTNFQLYEGAMIWQFDHRYAKPRYWVKEADLRDVFHGKRIKRIDDLKKCPADLRNDYEVPRLAIRKIASNTNERTLIVGLLPANSFTGNSLSVHFPFWHSKEKYNQLRFSDHELMILMAVLNSFVVDFILRSRMTTNLNLFFLYQLPIPRLTAAHPDFRPLVERAARLVGTAPEFDGLLADATITSSVLTTRVTGARSRNGSSGILS
jgi:hypothetical protein